MNKEIVVKETARNKGSIAYISAIKEASKRKENEFKTKANIFVRKLATKIILF